ncbi:MAG: hypothetical protein DSZ17_01615 [Candidatus Thioglobus sp.]|nr:MAG: hypothetical protein DSZ17_01615 [Candidatus Thioglobus sp.]
MSAPFGACRSQECNSGGYACWVRTAAAVAAGPLDPSGRPVTLVWSRRPVTASGDARRLGVGRVTWVGVGAGRAGLDRRLAGERGFPPAAEWLRGLAFLEEFVCGCEVDVVFVFGARVVCLFVVNGVSF